MTILNRLLGIQEKLEEHIQLFDQDVMERMKHLNKRMKEDVKSVVNTITMKEILENMLEILKKDVGSSLEDTIKEIKEVVFMIEKQQENQRDVWDGFLNFSTLFKAYRLITKFPNIPVVKFVDIDAYMGKWFQYKANLLAVAVESFGTNNTATYSKINDTTIKVENKNKNIFGRENTILGRAVLLDPPTGDLKVSFSNFDTSSEGNYRIVKLGKIKNGEYTYSIVLSPSNWFIFVLLRDLNDITVLNEVDYVLKELCVTNTFSELLVA